MGMMWFTLIPQLGRATTLPRCAVEAGHRQAPFTNQPLVTQRAVKFRTTLLLSQDMLSPT